MVGVEVGPMVGFDGAEVGRKVGMIVGVGDGRKDGPVGARVGFDVGTAVHIVVYGSEDQLDIHVPSDVE